MGEFVVVDGTMETGRGLLVGALHTYTGRRLQRNVKLI